MSPIYVIGVGLAGNKSLAASTMEMIAQATVLVGGQRLLQQFPHYQGEKWRLGDLSLTLRRVRDYWQANPDQSIVILATGDPLFFGLGRLLLNYFSPKTLEFIPAVSSVQLAFCRIKLPWQDARLVSVHGRDFDELISAVRRGDEKIAVLTDPLHSPAAIAEMILALDLPIEYDAWCCENLGGEQERVERFQLSALRQQTCDTLTVLILIRKTQVLPDLNQLPVMGIPDSYFYTFRDRPGLMTKREMRILALGELSLCPNHTCWDIGAGTGSMSIEMARLTPQGKVYAVEKSAAGVQLITNNMQRFGIENLQIEQGFASDVMNNWPSPDRIFIGGSGQQLSTILEFCQIRLNPDGVIVLAIATLENFHQAFTWLQRNHWQTRVLHVQLSKSLPIANLTRFQPLNPVYLISACQNEGLDE